MHDSPETTSPTEGPTPHSVGILRKHVVMVCNLHNSATQRSKEHSTVYTKEHQKEHHYASSTLTIRDVMYCHDMTYIL